MANNIIPIGEKFHGVDESVPTVNKGSATTNARRNAYTFPYSFQIPMSFNGGIVNFGVAEPPFTADNANWGWDYSNLADHTSVLILPFECYIHSISFKACGEPLVFSADAEVLFTVYKMIDPTTGDPNQGVSWAGIDNLQTRWDKSNDGHPGFLEEVSGSLFEESLPAGTGITVVAKFITGSVTPTGEEIDIVLTVLRS